MRNELIENIKPVCDPELNYSIVDMGLIYESWIEDGNAFVKMGVTSPGCPYIPQLIEDVKNTLKEDGYNEVDVEVILSPEWTPDLLSDNLKLELGYPI